MTRSLESAPFELVGDRRVLIFAPHTRIAAGRSGIHRVAMRLIEHLPGHARVDLVKWDEVEGQLRYCDSMDLRRYFRGPPPSGIDVHPFAHCVDYRFAETIPAHEPVVVLMPEVFFLVDNGNEIHARVIAQSLASGWTTAAIFYDLIPLKLPGYRERDAFAASLAELARVDVVLPISHFSAEDLRVFWRSTGAAFEDAGQRIVPVPLADRDRTGAVSVRSGGKRDHIVLLGTIEPRKQQLRVIHAFLKLSLAARAGLHLTIIGGLNPRCEEDFRALVESQPHITWLEKASDDDIDAAFARARFSVFASNEEGFGLPIVESLSRGVPCLSADHGAMREAATGGGCLLVDVADDTAIEAGMLYLGLDDDALGQLRGEIDDRAWRTWDDYAADVMGAIAGYERPAERAQAIAGIVAAEIGMHAPLGAGKPRMVVANTPVEIETIDGVANPAGPTSDASVYVVFVEAAVDADALSEGLLNALVRADAWFCRSRAVYEAIVARAAGSEGHGLLSGTCGWCDAPALFAAMVEARLAPLLEARIRRPVAAKRDAVFRTAWRRLELTRAAPTLTLVISTYDGAAFIERNIVHVLSLIEPLGERVRLVVFDNASRDDTAERVAPFATRGEVEYVRLSCNTGLLGNLHAISTLMRARHVWTIGVDDIIVPGAIERILAILDEDPACPFILPNFSVYHRETFAPEETCANLLADSRPVGIEGGPDAKTTVRDAASRHDNLLTAFYIIVFRSDLMAAVFNNPFTAPFFGSLSDTVPTTKAILEAFPDFAAVWLEEPVIAGNAHNTWRHHRVAWHGILMPQAFELAREAGLDRHLLRRWARHHVDLLREAERLYPNPDIAAAFPDTALEASFRVFGDHLLAAAG